MNRLEKLREKVDALLRQQPDPIERRCGFVHLYGVSDTCVLLADRRGFDAELAATAGMLHDLSTYETGDPTDHARHSALRAREMLSEMGDYSPDEIDMVTEAIRVHSTKDRVDGPFAELLKDADVLQHCLYDPFLRASLEEALFGLSEKIQRQQGPEGLFVFKGNADLAFTASCAEALTLCANYVLKRLTLDGAFENGGISSEPPKAISELATESEFGGQDELAAG